ncbi:MAG: hypothetical protein ABL952_02910 [Pyrinomonadaceae bacterium]
MRILDQESDKALKEIALFLTLSEAEELRDSLDSMLKNGSHHEHLSSNDFEKELTIAIYPGKSIDSFDERARRLIDNDI